LFRLTQGHIPPLPGFGAKRMFSKGNSRDLVIPCLHGCVAATRIVQLQKETHLAVNEEAEPVRRVMKQLRLTSWQP
jgi:hypothetical protein